MKIETDETNYIPPWLSDRDQEELRNIDHDNALIEKHNKENGLDISITPLYFDDFKSKLYTKKRWKRDLFSSTDMMPDYRSIADTFIMNNDIKQSMIENKEDIEKLQEEMKKEAKYKINTVGGEPKIFLDISDEKTKNMNDKLIELMEGHE
jgi:hypothetical protein